MKLGSGLAAAATVRLRATAALAGALALARADAAQVVIEGAPGSGQFGTSVTVLSNGNIVVTDPMFDTGSASDAGAVSLYDPGGTPISVLTGSRANDRVGSGGIVLLGTGNYVVRSPDWDSSSSANVGALTFGSATTGTSGVVSETNSLVGASTGDAVGDVVLLADGDYVALSPAWDGAAAVDAGAATLGSGTRVTSGVVSGSNSSVGGSAGDGAGMSVVALPNGNYVVCRPGWDGPNGNDAGAVTFVAADDPTTGTVSSANSLVGNSAGDDIAGDCVLTLGTGNYLVTSPRWDGAGAPDAGAVTFGSATSGVVGVLSSENSLVGTSEEDRVGRQGVLRLATGNYVVISPEWDNGTVRDAGAVTFGFGSTGISGIVSPDNSLVGSAEDDRIGSSIVVGLSNGNYVVPSSSWDNGSTVNVGAVTFGNGASGIAGAVSVANSLIGTAANDLVGVNGVVALASGNYVVRSPQWNNGSLSDAGAATFCLGSIGRVGVVSSDNSLVGGSPNDGVGGGGVIPLRNGNYVVRSPTWDNGPASNAGAMTFGSGTTGTSGTVSPLNSLVGSSTDDLVGNNGTVELANGNFVINSGSWNNGTATDAGAVTFASGAGGIVGVVSPSNSLVGSSPGDNVGMEGAVALDPGGYVVRSPSWDNLLASNAGAVTFGSGTSGVSGPVGAANSLVGTASGDAVGTNVVALVGNGNYVVISPDWNSGGVVNAGAVTHGSGLSGVVGAVSSGNSLVGSSSNDRIGSDGVVVLSEGGYVVRSTSWNNVLASDAGAITFGSGASGIAGEVSAANSLVGATSNDIVGNGGITGVANGNCIVRSPYWNGTVNDAGAITLGLANGSTVGVVSSDSSVLGSVDGAGSTHVFAYDALRNQLVVGQRASNRVVLHRPGVATSTLIVGDEPDPSTDDELVTVTADVSAATAPADGRVTFRSSNGEGCTDATPSASSGLAVFSCVLSFVVNGNATIVAEYTGSTTHSFSRSPPEQHSAILQSFFANGFE